MLDVGVGRGTHTHDVGPCYVSRKKKKNSHNHSRRTYLKNSILIRTRIKHRVYRHPLFGQKRKIVPSNKQYRHSYFLQKQKTKILPSSKKNTVGKSSHPVSQAKSSQVKSSRVESSQVKSPLSRSAWRSSSVRSPTGSPPPGSGLVGRCPRCRVEGWGTPPSSLSLGSPRTPAPFHVTPGLRAGERERGKYKRRTFVSSLFVVPSHCVKRVNRKPRGLGPDETLREGGQGKHERQGKGVLRGHSLSNLCVRSKPKTGEAQLEIRQKRDVAVSRRKSIACGTD